MEPMFLYNMLDTEGIIAYSLKRQFSNNGIYKDLCLYNFLDNHDVNRIGSLLKSDAIKYGEYEEILVKNEQFVFARTLANETKIVVLNMSESL